MIRVSLTQCFHSYVRMSFAHKFILAAANLRRTNLDVTLSVARSTATTGPESNKELRGIAGASISSAGAPADRTPSPRRPVINRTPPAHRCARHHDCPTTTAHPRPAGIRLRTRHLGSDLRDWPASGAPGHYGSPDGAAVMFRHPIGRRSRGVTSEVLSRVISGSSDH
jgi:hypothetical protein